MIFWRKKKKDKEAEETQESEKDLPQSSEESAETIAQKKPEESAESPAQKEPTKEWRSADWDTQDEEVLAERLAAEVPGMPGGSRKRHTEPEEDVEGGETEHSPEITEPSVDVEKEHPPFPEESAGETAQKREPEGFAEGPAQKRPEESAEAATQKEPEESAEDSDQDLPQTPEESAEDTAEKESSSWFSKLTAGLSKSSNKITQGLTDVLTKKKLDQEMLDELEDVLIMADLGPKTASKIVQEFARDRFEKEIDEQDIKEALAETIADILHPVARPLDFSQAIKEEGPQVVLVCGVNGAGKTTTIGKIAYKLKNKAGLKVIMAAGDTFRAAAVEQLQVWAERAGSLFYKKDVGADAGAVVYESYQKTLSEDADVLLVDTAGRLHNKSNLMAELQKIVRVLQKQDESLPHDVLLVLDATTGQNAFEQVRIFGDMINVTGLAVTKLDGSAKGGVVVGLADQFGLPIHMVGVGEGIEDLQPFDPEQFARSLVGLG